MASRSQAAAVLVAPTMVAPWRDVSAAMKPAFTMTGDTAATLVMPTTETIGQAQVSAFGAGLAIGLPQTSTLATTTTNTGFPAATAATTTTTTPVNGTTTTTTNSTAPGTAPAVPSGLPAGASLPALVAAGALGQDPTLRYKSAYYLNQTVQLLNQEIDNIAKRRCYVSYVVRLKLGVMPYQPGLAYSAHTHIAFFPRANRSGLPRRPSNAIAPECRGNDAASANYVYPKVDGYDDDADQDERPTVFSELPKVVPLIAADDLDVAMHTQSSEVATQLGLALNFMVHGIGGNASANAVRQTLTSIANQDLTSSLTISRDNDNTLYVEITPANGASGRPALVGQTYDAAVLLLIPRAYFGGTGDDLRPASIRLTTSTDLRNARNGSILSQGRWDGYIHRIDTILLQNVSDKQIIHNWTKTDDKTKVKLIVGALQYLQNGDFGGFVNRYFYDEMLYQDTIPPGVCSFADKQSKALDAGNSLQCFPRAAASALWAALVSINDDSPYKYADFEAPIPDPIRIIANQTVVLPDDQTHPIAALLGNIDAQSVNGLAATLHFTRVATPATVCPPAAPTLARRTPGTRRRIAHAQPCKVTPADSQPVGPMDMPLTIGALDTTSHTLALGLPSLGKMGITTIKDATITFGLIGCNPRQDVCPDLYDTLPPKADTIPHPAAPEKATVNALLYKADVPPSPITVSPGSGQIVITPGTTSGTLTVVIGVASGSTDTGALLTFTGTADPVSVVGGSAAVVLGTTGYQLVPKTPYTISFANLVPGQTITLSAQGAAGTAADKLPPVTASFTVVPPYPTDARP